MRVLGVHVRLPVRVVFDPTAIGFSKGGEIVPGELRATAELVADVVSIDETVDAEHFSDPVSSRSNVPVQGNLRGG